MSTKTVSIRLPGDVIERIDEKCSDKECCRNDYFKSLIEKDLNTKEVKIVRVRL